MNLYLSSFKIGDDILSLKKIIPANRKTAYISNALDFARKEKWVKELTNSDLKELRAIGLTTKRFDLTKYFDHKNQLDQDLKQFGVIWVSGGNVFVLRQAMALSGFDNWLIENQHTSEILYGGYSAGACVVCPSLRGLELVDSTKHRPYGNKVIVIWKGLKLVNYLIVPHFNSDHPEAKAIQTVVKYCQKNKLKYRTIRDGEAIIEQV